MEPEPSQTHRRRVKHRLLFVSGLLIALFVLELASVKLLVPYDLLFHRWIQEQRTCALDQVARILKDWTTAPYATAVLVLGAAGFFACRRRWQDLGSFFIITVGAALLGEWVKAFVSRARPAALSFVDYGSSFPSGHIISAVTILGAIYYLFSPSLTFSRWKRFVGIGIAMALVATIGYQRIYFMRHWLTDVIGGLLLGASWFFFVIAALHGSIGKRSFMALGAGFGAAFLALWLVPGYRVKIASPTNLWSVSVSQINLTAYPPETIQPRQRSLGIGRPRQTIWRFLKAKTAIDLTLAQGKDYLLIFAATPRVPSGEHACRQVEFSFNGHPLKTLILMDGWRDYQIPIDGKAVSAGKNQLIIHFDNHKTDSLLFSDLEIHSRALGG